MNAIKYYRMQKGLTQDELAEFLDLAKQTISNYETGFRTPSVDRYKKIAKELKLDDWTLLTKEV